MLFAGVPAGLNSDRKRMAENGNSCFPWNVYRNDEALYHKQYQHHPIQFGSYLSSQSCYYDEQSRIICKYCYTISGSISYYYIYSNNSKKPAYCLALDSYGEPWPEMISYGN